MATAAQDFIDNIISFRFNPVGIQRTVIKAINEVNNGEQQYFDATTPPIQAMSAGAFEIAAFMQQHEAESRRRYPSMAQTPEDLYLHMSDQDYIDRFAIPATANFKLQFYKDELLAKMKLEPETGYMKLTIPRNTSFEVAGTVFTMQYPIDIRQLAHDGLQIVYNNDIVSPLQELESNSIDYDIEENQNGEYVVFKVATTQFKITQLSTGVSKSKETSLQLPFNDMFYYARVYHMNTTTGKWDELVTTHADGIYDITTPTAVLQVVGNNLSVKIPQIYVNTGQLSSTIRVDLYETKGAIIMPLGDYPSNSTAVTWKTWDSTEMKNPYSAPLPNMAVVAYSDDDVMAGSNEMPFETLRKNVINNAVGPIRQAVTLAQLQASLEKKGYDLVADVDNVTNRVYLATRSMPTPDIVAATTASSTGSGNKLLTAAAASIETLTISTNTLAGLSTVVDNGSAITVTPDTIYQVVNGITQPVAASEIARILALPADKRALEVTNGSYLYTPFHYVMDMSNDAFEIRPYHLDMPVAESKVFVKQNDTTLMLVGTSIYGIVRTETGYLLQVQTRSDDAYKELPDAQVFAQLAFIPYGERDRAYVNGVLVGKSSTGERIYNFDLSTNFNIDSDNNIEMTKFTMYNSDPRVTKTPLLTSFDLIYSTSAVMTARWQANEVDDVLGTHLLPSRIAGINWERIKVTLGTSLDMLWTRARSVISSVVYETYSSDEPAVYTADIYERDANGVAFKVVDGELVRTLLHAKGDPILSPDGQPTYTHRAGDLKRDADGNLIVKNPRGLLRQVDLMLFEGVYWFATDTTTANYRNTLTKALVSWLVNDLEQFKSGLLDKTRIYFYPKTTSGVVNVFIGDDIRKSIPAGQGFTVTLSVSKQVYDNTNLRARLEAATITAISNALKEKTVAMSAIVSTLRSIYGSDVVDVEISGLGGDANYSVISVDDETDRLSIRKRLTAQADGYLAAEEDVTFAYRIQKS